MAARPEHVILTDLSSNLTLQADAHRQLDNIRRRIADLEQQELGLVSSIDARGRRFDYLLDELLAARQPVPSR